MWSVFFHDTKTDPKKLLWDLRWNISKAWYPVMLLLCCTWKCIFYNSTNASIARIPPNISETMFYLCSFTSRANSQCPFLCNLGEFVSGNTFLVATSVIKRWRSCTVHRGVPCTIRPHKTLLLSRPRRDLFTRKFSLELGANKEPSTYSIHHCQNHPRSLGST